MRGLTPAAAIRIPSASTARSAAVGQAWRGEPAYRQLAAALGPAGVTDRDVLADRAAALFADNGWLDALLAPLVTALADDPWFEPPLRTSRDALRCGAILFETPAVTVTLAAVSAARLRLPPAVVLSGRLSVVRYLHAGDARFARWTAPPLSAICTAVAMAPCRRLPDRVGRDGEVVRIDGRTAARVPIAAGRDLVTLTATIRVGGDPVAREYDAATGAFRRMATTDEGAARAQVLLSLLRASGAAGADAAFDAATRDGAFFLRWSAMREWLAHDWRAAWPRLEAMAAGDPHPEVRDAAAATLAALTRQAA